MMLHRHFEKENPPGLTKAADLAPKGTDPDDPLYVALDGVKSPVNQPEEEALEEAREEPQELQEEPQPSRRGRGRRGGGQDG